MLIKTDWKQKHSPIIFKNSNKVAKEKISYFREKNTKLDKKFEKPKNFPILQTLETLAIGATALHSVTLNVDVSVMIALATKTRVVYRSTKCNKVGLSFFEQL